MRITEKLFKEDDGISANELFGADQSFNAGLAGLIDPEENKGGSPPSKFTTEPEMNYDELSKLPLDQLTDKQRSFVEAEKAKLEKDTDDNIDDDSKKTDVNEGVKLTDKDIQKKLDEILNKDDDKITDEDRKFVEENLPKSNLEQAVNLLDPDYSSVLEGNQFEDSPEGIANFVKATEEVTAKKVYSAIVNKYPAVGQLIEHLNSNKSINTFLQKVNIPTYSEFDISKEEDQMQIFDLYYKGKGMAQEDIDLLKERAKDSDLLKSKSENFIAELKKEANIKVQEQEAREQEILAKEQAAAEQQWKETVNILNSGKIMGYELPKSEVVEFGRYLQKVNNGRYQADIDFENATTEQKLFLDYLVFNKFQKLGNLRTTPSGTSNSIKDKIKSYKQKNVSDKFNRTGKNNGSNDELEDLSFMKNINFEQLIN